MMQQCMDMMNSMMGGGTTDTSTVSSMGANLPLSLVVGLILAVGLGYLLGGEGPECKPSRLLEASWKGRELTPPAFPRPDPDMCCEGIVT